MARRTGKAATRRARQQRRARLGPTAPAPMTGAGVTASEDADARPAPPRQPLFAAVPASSRLGANAQEEYHYVGRDLRNTAVLSLIMLGLLAASVVIVNVLGI